MDGERLIGHFISNFFAALPFLLVYLGGLVFAIVNWSRSPKAAGLAAAGIAILLLTMLFCGLFNMFSMEPIYRNIRDPRLLLGFLAFMRAVIEAVGTGLIIAGVFVGRDSAAGGMPATGIPSKPY